MSDDLIKRPPDEEFDTQMEVERNPCGAWMAIQAQADRIEELEREKAELSASLDENWVTHQEVLFSKRYAAKAEAKLAKAVETLRVANLYIDNLNAHEGAEGFSVSTEEAADAYYAALADLEGKE